MTAPARWTAYAAGLVLVLAGCVRPPPKTVPARDPAGPPSVACHELEKRLALQVPDSSPPSDAEAEELLRRLAALADDPALRDCLAARMAASPGDPER